MREIFHVYHVYCEDGGRVRTATVEASSTVDALRLFLDLSPRESYRGRRSRALMQAEEVNGSAFDAWMGDQAGKLDEEHLNWLAVHDDDARGW